MKTIYRNPINEDGIHNIILQNRCGNRLTLLLHEAYTELEFIYKPNAFRRKDYSARNFSNRDNFTTLFKEFNFPEIKASFAKDFLYDPFHTKVHTKTEYEAKNELTFINIVDENCFAISATSPLTISFVPHKEFNVSDGLITEKFIERGEEIVTFIKFSSFTDNRYRVLDDGTHILQLCEGDVILVGGEENSYQVNRVLRSLQNKNLEDLIQYNENRIKNYTSKSDLKLEDGSFQTVLDINKRVNYSMIDEGGVTFGALQRIYHLNWIRDNLMSTTMMALAGTPDLLKLALPYVFNNPSTTKVVDGKELRRYLQMVGTRWGKGEEDGLFYTTYALYILFQTTGNDEYLYSRNLKCLIDSIDYTIDTRFVKKEGLFGSDTIGETTLKGSSFYGYDAVNGSLETFFDAHNQNNVSFCYTYYQNSNMFNILKMIEVLIKASPDVDKRIADKYRSLSEQLRESIKRKFVNPEGYYYAALIIYEDGEEKWINVIDNAEFWEHSWANSIGPFFVDIEYSLKTAQMMIQWSKENYHGLCPINTLSRMVKEYGYSKEDYVKLLTPEIEDALTYTEKYPMTGASTEYEGQPDTYRGLPFSTGSMMFSLYSLVLQSLPMGIAVRCSNFVGGVDNFYYRNHRIDASFEGVGEVVGAWSINGKNMKYTLQIPEDMLVFGQNKILIHRTSEYDGFRLYSSSAILRRLEDKKDEIVYEFQCPTICELVFENFDKGKEFTIFKGENPIEYEAMLMEGTNKTIITCENCENLIVRVKL